MKEAAIARTEGKIKIGKAGRGPNVLQRKLGPQLLDGDTELEGSDVRVIC